MGHTNARIPQNVDKREGGNAAHEQFHNAGKRWNNTSAQTLQCVKEKQGLLLSPRARMEWESKLNATDAPRPRQMVKR
ncbi:hypothetical protein FACS1894168_2250 [Deltaproteobacteria bacterium]|nr:hypothetical protein FACS1894168_2250 [Deltaproteobacteria bacterium]